MTAVGVPHTYSIRYTFNLSSTTGGPPLTISETIPVTSHSGDSTDSVRNSLTLLGNYNAQSFSGSASLAAKSWRAVIRDPLAPT